MLEDEKENGISLDDESDSYGHAQVELTRKQKIAAAALGFFAFFIVIVWALQFKNGIANPLVRQAELEKARQGQTENTASICPDGNCSDLADEDLKAKDTDGDGLSDYDELNFFGTSPYLEDSDSDGFLDKAEIDSDNNPNCPAGRVCEEIDLEKDKADVVGDDSDEMDLSALEELINGKTSPASSSSAITGDTPKADDLREMLKSSGVSDDILSVFTDEELLRIYADSTSQ